MGESLRQMRGNFAESALSGVKVVEHASFVAGPYCAKLLADMGAEVIKIEQPGVGDEARKRGPFPGGRSDPEKSGLFLYLNTSKTGITLNLRSAAGRGIFKRLVGTADIVIEDSAPRAFDDLGIGYGTLSEVNPGLVMTSVTPFGQNGPCADYKAYYLNTYHSGMLGYITPVGSASLDKPPLKVGGLVGEYASGLAAALATLGALFYQRRTGRGQYVDVSKQEALISLGRMNACASANGFAHTGRIVNLTGRGGILRCRDGHVCVHMPEDSQWRGFVQLMGCPEWATDGKFGTIAGRMLYLNEILPFIEEWAETRSKEEIYHSAQKLGCTVTPVMTAEDIVESEQSKSRGLFREVEHPVAGNFELPIGPFVFSRTPPQVRKPAPLLGEDNEEIYIDRLGLTREDLSKMRDAGVI
jgi:CoA:oxalate CoA-transferase